MPKLFFTCVVAGSLLLAACTAENEPKAVTASAATPTTVAVTVVHVSDWPSGYEATGTVRARTAATVSSRIMGTVQSVHVQAGDRVLAGQTLVVIDARELNIAMERAETARTEVLGMIPEADGMIAAAKANLDLAEATYRRIAQLSEKNSATRQEMDEATARSLAAKASYDMARAHRAQLDARVSQADQTRRSAMVAQGYAVLTAPFAGVVTARNVEPGNMAAPGASLLTIEGGGQYRLEATTDESRFGAVRVGEHPEVSLEAVGCNGPGRVSEIVPAVDPASHAYIVKVDLPACPAARSGVFGRVVFPLGARKVLDVPATSLLERGQLQYVYVAEGGTARLRLVTAGERGKGDQSGRVEILSGLRAGDRVIAPAPTNLSDGAPIIPANAEVNQ